MSCPAVAVPALAQGVTATFFIASRALQGRQ
jgi:hypothetical protein